MSRRTTAPRRARTVAVAAVTAAGAALLSACAPTTTALNYSPSDGVTVSVGADEDRDFTKLRGLNLMVVAAEEGAAGNLLGALANNSQQDATFTLAPEGAEEIMVDVAAGETVYIGGEAGDPILLDAVSAAPGAGIPSTLAAGDEVTEFELPVVDGALPEYEAYVPDAEPSAAAEPSDTASAPEPDASASSDGATPSPAASPDASPSPSSEASGVAEE